MDQEKVEEKRNEKLLCWPFSKTKPADSDVSVLLPPNKDKQIKKKHFKSFEQTVFLGAGPLSLKR